MQTGSRSIVLRLSAPLFCLCASLIVAAQLSLFPLQMPSADVDPSVYLYIGRQMHDGAVPYADLFDHKGPLLYFIQYFGLLLSPNGYGGVWLLELANLLITAWALYLITALLTEDHTVRYLALFAALVLCSLRPLISEQGNIVEEYALPWIALSLFIFLKYFKTDRYRFCEIVLLGIGFAAVCLLRLNMVAVWAFFLPVVVIRLLIKKRFRDLWLCIGGFLLGMAIVCIPTLLYLIATNSLEAMIDCYLRFNLGYSDVLWLSRIETAFQFMDILWFAVVAAILSLIAEYKNPIFWLNAFCTGITLILCSLSGRGYHHYPLILLPLTAPYFVWAIRAIYALLEKLLRRVPHPAQEWSTSLLLLGCVVLAAVTVVRNTNPNDDRAWRATTVGTYLSEHTDADDDVLILGNSCRYYLESNRKTENRFFFQTPPIDTSDALYDAFVCELERVPSDIIVAPWEKGSWKEISSRIGDICALFDEKVQTGEYVYEDFGAFYVYRHSDGKDNNHG